MIPWERLVAQGEEYGVLGVAHGLRIVLGGSGPRRTMVGISV